MPTYPTGMTRVSSIRRIYKPGLYRMEVALGDLGFHVEVSEAAIKKVPDEVAEPETPEEPTAEKPEPLTTEDWTEIVKQQQMTEWYKLVSQDVPLWATRTTTPYQLPNWAKRLLPAQLADESASAQALRTAWATRTTDLLEMNSIDAAWWLALGGLK